MNDTTQGNKQASTKQNNYANMEWCNGTMQQGNAMEQHNETTPKQCPDNAKWNNEMTKGNKETNQYHNNAKQCKSQWKWCKYLMTQQRNLCNTMSKKTMQQLDMQHMTQWLDATTWCNDLMQWCDAMTWWCNNLTKCDLTIHNTQHNDLTMQWFDNAMIWQCNDLTMQWLDKTTQHTMQLTWQSNSMQWQKHTTKRKKTQHKRPHHMQWHSITCKDIA